MRIDTDNRAVVRVSADRTETLDILRADRSELERLLQQSGLKLDQQSLEFNQRDAYPKDSERGETSYAGESRDDPSLPSSEVEVEQVSITHEGLWLMSGVNIRV